MKQSLLTIRCLAPALAALVLIGCGESGGPDPKVEAARLDQAKSLRSYFEKTGGDYTRLSPQDKAEYLKLVGGDDAKGQKTWDMMKYGPGGAPSGATSGAPSGPSGSR